MRHTFFIFFIIVITIYLVSNYYLFVRGLQVFSMTPLLKRYFIIGFWTLVPMFLIGSILERTFSSAFSEWIYRIGSFWLAFMKEVLCALTLSLLTVQFQEGSELSGVTAVFLILYAGLAVQPAVLPVSA